MLPSPHRLKRPADVSHVRRTGRRWRHPLATLVVVKHDEPRPSRFAVAVSRRVGKAVVRNRTRRRFREVIRLHLDELQLNYDCLFIVHPPAASVPYGQVEEAVLMLLRRAHVIRQGNWGGESCR